MNLTKIANALDLIADQWTSASANADAPADDTQATLQANLGDRYTPSLGEKIAADPELKEFILGKVAAAEPQSPRPFGVPVERPDVQAALARVVLLVGVEGAANGHELLGLILVDIDNLAGVGMHAAAVVAVVDLGVFGDEDFHGILRCLEKPPAEAGGKVPVGSGRRGGEG